MFTLVMLLSLINDQSKRSLYANNLKGKKNYFFKREIPRKSKDSLKDPYFNYPGTQCFFRISTTPKSFLPFFNCVQIGFFQFFFSTTSFANFSYVNVHLILWAKYILLFGVWNVEWDAIF